VADNPPLRQMQAEVEALLVNRLSGEHLHYLVPIDEGYRLGGLVRLHWAAASIVCCWSAASRRPGMRTICARGSVMRLPRQWTKP
jgi:hypothetical protein